MSVNVLIVDDQKLITDTLAEGIQWKKLLYDGVYTANSAMEARLCMKSLPIDLLVTDIEMPEEDGLALVGWARENTPDTECILLTSHAEFDYARQGLRMGVLDYILQPVRLDDFEEKLRKAYDVIEKKKRSSRQKQSAVDNNYILLNTAALEMKNNNPERADIIFHRFVSFYEAMGEHDWKAVTVTITHWRKLTEKWQNELVCRTLSNILDELLEPSCRSVFAPVEENRYLGAVITAKDEMTDRMLQKALEDLAAFINAKLPFDVDCTVLSGEEPEIPEFHVLYEKSLRAGKNQSGEKGKAGEDAGEDPIKEAAAYIRKNISRNISRTEVAEMLHLNEAYFSRLFREQTGVTFKEYVTAEKVKEAEKLLKHSRLSVSIIGSKVGYDNFSYFSQVFRKQTGYTPQEYRKQFQK